MCSRCLRCLVLSKPKLPGVGDNDSLPVLTTLVSSTGDFVLVLSEGAFVGSQDGFMVGENVGESLLVGLSVGLGAALGSDEGVSVGLAALGSAEGVWVGERVGFEAVGSNVGLPALGSDVGLPGAEGSDVG